MPGGWEGGEGPLPTAVWLLGGLPGLVPGCMCPGNKPRCGSNPSFRSSQPKVPHWNPNHPYLAHPRWALRESIPSCTPASRVTQRSARALTELNNMLSGPAYEYYKTDKNSGYRTAIKTTMLFTRKRETVAACLITGGFIWPYHLEGRQLHLHSFFRRIPGPTLSLTHPAKTKGYFTEKFIIDQVRRSR